MGIMIILHQDQLDWGLTVFVPHRLMCLNTCSPDGNSALENCRNLWGQNFGRSGFLKVGAEVL